MIDGSLVRAARREDGRTVLGMVIDGLAERSMAANDAEASFHSHLLQHWHWYFFAFCTIYHLSPSRTSLSFHFFVVFCNLCYSDLLSRVGNFQLASSPLVHALAALIPNALLMWSPF